MKLRDIRLNQLVNTPLGQGLFQGVFGVMERGTETEKEELGLVRINVDETTMQHLRDSNCVTPTARTQGLWTFTEGEIQ